MKKNIYFSIVLLVIGFASIFRFYGLKDKGIFEWDEGYYLNEAKTLSFAVKFLRENRGETVQKLKEDLMEKGCVVPTGVAKPTFMGILSGFLLVTGVADWHAFLLAAIFGLFSIFIFAMIGYRYFSWRAGLIFTFLWTFSGISIFFARAPHPLIFAVVFLLLAFFCYFAEKCFLAGIFLSLAYTSHYCLLPNVGLFFLLEFIYAFAKRKNAGSFLLMLAGFLLPIFFYEGVYQAVGYIFRSGLRNINYMTYLQYLYRQHVWASGGSSYKGHDWLFYPRVFAQMEGLVLLFFSLFAGLFLLKNIDRKIIFILVQFYFGFLFWVLNPGTQILRVFMPTVLWGIFVVGVVADRLIEKISPGFRTQILLVVFLSAIVILPNQKTLWQIVQLKSGYKEAAEFIKNENIEPIISLTAAPIWQFYLSKRILANRDRINSEEDFRGFYERSAGRYYIADFHNWPLLSENYDFLGELEKQHAPLAKFENQMVDFEPFLYQGYSRKVASEIKKDPLARYIRIYDLNRIYH